MTNAPTNSPQRPSGNLTAIGLLFIILGLLAIGLPAWATVAVEQLVAMLLLFWGAAGFAFGLSLHPNPDARMTVALFALVLALGAIFLIFPRDGAETMIMLLIAVFLIQGAASISVGIGLRRVTHHWGIPVLSGLASVLLGALIVTGWPGTAAWTLGLLTGMNFLTTGIALILLRRGLDGAGRS